MAVVPVFVSSTFRDFHSERDVIRSRVATALDDVLRPLGARVELLDLRWGVNTHGEDDEAAQQKVLDVCIDELDRCRPLFVGLVGDRFGWTPSRERLEIASARSEVKAALPDLPLSVTALEFWHGLLAADATADAVVAVRELVGDAPADWREGDREGVQWLREQVRAAESREPDRVQVLDYQARVAGAEIARADLSAFADHLVEALTPLVLQRAQEVGAADTGYTAAAQLMAESRSVVVGRDRLLDDVERAVLDGPGVVLEGPSGVGKTTVVLAVCERLAERGWTVARVLVGAGPGSTSTQAVIGLLAEQLGVSVPDAVEVGREGESRPLAGEALLSWWASVVAGLPERTLVVVDALDRLDSGDARDTVEVLRSVPVAGVRFLASTTEPAQATALEIRGLQVLPVGPLDPEDAAAAVRRLAKSDGGRDLPGSVVRVLAAAPRSGIWLRMAVTELSWLDRTDFARAEQRATAGKKAAEALVEMLVSEAEELPATDADLAGRLVARAAAEFGDQRQAGLFLGALALTQSGFTPADLQSLAGDPHDPLPVTRARQLLGAQLVPRDASGRWAFDHLVVREAALKLAVDKGWDERQIHGRIAEYLATDGGGAGDGLRAVDEVAALDRVWHSLLSGTPELSAKALARTWLSALLLEQVGDVVVRAVRSGRSVGEPALVSITGLPMEPAAVHVACVRQLQSAAQDHSGEDLRLSEAQVIVGSSLEIARRLAADPDSAQAARDVSVSLDNVGRVAVAGGDLAGARVAYTESLEMRRRLAAADPDSAQAARDVSVSLDNVGRVAVAGGDLAGARVAYTESLEMRRRLAAADPDSAQAARDVSVSLDNVGRVAVAGGDLAGARVAYTESLEIARRLAAADPDSAQAARDVSVSLDNVGEVAVAGGDLAGARVAYTESLEIARRLAAADPDSAQAARDVWVSLARLAEFTETDQGSDSDAARAAWTDVVDHSDRMRVAGFIMPADERFAQQARSKATRGPARRSLAEIMAGAGDPSDVEAVTGFWLETPTWDESFEVLQEGQALLITQMGLDAVLKLADGPARSIHAAILQAVARGLSVDLVKTIITDSAVAQGVAGQALNNRDHPVVQLVLSLNRELGSSAEGLAILLASHLATGQTNEAVQVARQIAGANKDAAIQEVPYLRRVAAELPVDFLDSDALAAVIAALEGS